MNIIEHDLAKAVGLVSVTAGQDIRCRVDFVAAHDVTAPMAIASFKEIGVNKVFDCDKVVLVVDHIVPASTVQARNNCWALKDFADAFGAALYAWGERIIHQIIAERHRLKLGSISASSRATLKAGGLDRKGPLGARRGCAI